MQINSKSIETILFSKYGERAFEHYQKLLDYQRIVTEVPFRTQMARFQLEGKDLSERLADLDDKRTRKHNAAIASLGTLNNIAEKLGIAPVIDCNPHETHRADIAYAIFKHVKDVLDNDAHGKAEKH